MEKPVCHGTDGETVLCCATNTLTSPSLASKEAKTSKTQQGASSFSQAEVLGRESYYYVTTMRGPFSLVALSVVFSPIPSAHGLTTSTVANESSNNLARWEDKWATNTIRWHRDDVNDVIKAHGQKLLNGDKSCTADMRVLVPLCGKSLDVAFFAENEDVTEVVGVDGIRKALEEFVKEHPDLKIEEEEATELYETFKGKKITLLKGDFFDLTDESTGGKFDAVYDRASLVAISPEMRDRYVEVMQRVISPGGKILLVTVEHDMGSGPPFSISESDIRNLYESKDWVDSVTQLNPDETELDQSGRLNRWYLIQTK